MPASKGFSSPAAAQTASTSTGAQYLGNIVLTQSATVAIQAGVRRVEIATPAAWGVKAGDNLLAFPVSVPNGSYGVMDVIAIGANTVSVALIAPLLAIGANYAIPCRLVRINT